MASRRGRRARRQPVPRVPDAIPEQRAGRVRAAAIPAVFLVAFAALAVASYRQASATWDEPIHLTAGYAALAEGDFSIDPSHPPLLRMWAALPTLWFDGVSMDAPPADRGAGDRWLTDAYLYAHEFLYIDNDADRLLYAARFMTVLLGALLGVFLFLWAREWLGLAPAVVALAFFTLEPNLLAHSSLVTTDLGVTCFVFGAIYFAWRTSRAVTRTNVAGLTVCFSLAVVSKFSAVLLAPAVALLLGASVVLGTGMTARRAAAILALLAVASFTALWASYGFRYVPTGGSSWTFALHDTAMAAQSPSFAAVVEWLDSRRLLPNAFVQGLFYTQTSVQQMPAYLAGRYSADGWWYYFPAAFVMKAPIALVVLTALGGALAVVRRGALGTVNLLFVAVPALVFLGAAMASGVNIGLRHILPVFPFVILLAAAGASQLLRARPRAAAVALGALVIVCGAELATAYPQPLTFFNQAFGGPRNGYRYLADSNLAWGQNLKLLKAWMDDHGVDHVNLAYFGQADPAYYGINVTHLPGAPMFAADDSARPRLPGYVAVSGTTLTGVYAPPWWRLFYAPFRELEPAAILGNSMRVYWVDRWPEATGPDYAEHGVEAHRGLADALLLGFDWPERALVHYRAYLDLRPDDTQALVNYGIALVATDRIDEGVAQFRHAVSADGTHGPARLTLAKALLGSRDLEGASEHARRAVALLPDDAEAHHLLGRIRAIEGNLPEAAEAFERAVQLAPRHPEAAEYLRRVREAMGPDVRAALSQGRP